MRAFAHDVFTYPLPPGHHFPLGKYRLVRERAEASPAIQVADATAATEDELVLAHEPGYLERVSATGLTRREELALGLPWSQELVERARRSVGATLLAADAALADGIGANLGGGTHHAFAGSARGFSNSGKCLRTFRATSLPTVRSRFVLDPSGKMRSIFSDENYPFRRVPGDLELDLADGTADERYLAGSRGFSRSPLRALGPTSASISPAPTPTRATGSGGSRSPRRGWPPATSSCGTPSPAPVCRCA